MKVVVKFVAGLVLLALIGGLTFYLRPLIIADATLRYGLWKQGVKSKSVRVDGNQIHYFEAGASNQPALVLVHGLGDRSEAYAALIPKFAAAGFHVYALDLLGYGRSAKPRDADYSIGAEERVVAGFMRELGLQHVDVVGWSMGGWVAMALALNHPELVARLVLYDAAGIYWHPSWTPALFHPQNGTQLAELFTMLTPNPPKLPDFAVRDLLRKFDSQWWVVDKGLGSMLSGHELLDFRLAALKVPTLIVWGREDRLIPLDVGERMHQGIAGSQILVVDGCGHLAPSECTLPVVNGTVAFLQAH